MRITLDDLRNNSRLAEAINVPPADARFAQYVNAAIQLLLPMGKWWDTMAKFKLSTSQGLVSLPTQIAAVEAVAVDSRPLPIRDSLYEFLAHGYGTRSDTAFQGFGEALYRGSYPTQIDVSGTDKKLTLICDQADDVGKVVNVFGRDGNGNLIRTNVAGVWQDGEPMAIAKSPGTTSGNVFSVVDGIQFPSTMVGQSWLYTLSTTDASQVLIGQYEYYDLRPQFPRWLFPSIFQTTTQPCLIEYMAKLAYRDVVNGTDYLLIGNPMSLLFGCKAVLAFENDSIQMGQGWLGLAVKQLDMELDHYLGSGRTAGITVSGLHSEPMPNLPIEM